MRKTSTPAPKPQDMMSRKLRLNVVNLRLRAIFPGVPGVAYRHQPPSRAVGEFDEIAIPQYLRAGQHLTV